MFTFKSHRLILAVHVSVKFAATRWLIIAHKNRIGDTNWNVMKDDRHLNENAI